MIFNRLLTRLSKVPILKKLPIFPTLPMCPNCGVKCPSSEIVPIKQGGFFCKRGTGGLSQFGLPKHLKERVAKTLFHSDSDSKPGSGRSRSNFNSGTGTQTPTVERFYIFFPSDGVMFRRFVFPDEFRLFCSKCSTPYARLGFRQAPLITLDSVQVMLKFGRPDNENVDATKKRICACDFCEYVLCADCADAEIKVLEDQMKKEDNLLLKSSKNTGKIAPER